MVSIKPASAEVTSIGVTYVMILCCIAVLYVPASRCAYRGNLRLYAQAFLRVFRVFTVFGHHSRRVNGNPYPLRRRSPVSRNIAFMYLDIAHYILNNDIT